MDKAVRNWVPAIGLVAALTLAGCTGRDGRVESTQAPVATARGTTAPAILNATDLESAPVPSACQHPGGTLVYGRLPLIPEDEGFVALARTQGDAGEARHAEVAMTGSGAELLAVLDCSAGGVTWPQVLVLYGPGPTLLGSLDLGTVASDLAAKDMYAEHVQVESMQGQDDHALLELTSYEGAGFEVRTWTTVLRYQDGQLHLDDLVPVSGPENPYPPL